MVELFIPLTRHVIHAVDALDYLGLEPPSVQLCRGRVGGRPVADPRMLMRRRSDWAPGPFHGLGRNSWGIGGETSSITAESQHCRNDCIDRGWSDVRTLA
jgi:hypothetical protein